ncbi:class I SAM-dependent methyltransferase [Amnibacterium kyonggiense]|uniref:Methyltransferase family protein n=1 Tax=Amnibacterium kyonggiense TaxID=595671 RepID=A0A4R7FS64_9MICO|nr:class I SAM-dependent methyltransferase [Amnibacterium kyonggiense]TDS80687.1 hypothetical protein CLV52_1253 [Amnibacterium kyonggiense]
MSAVAAVVPRFGAGGAEPWAAALAGAPVSLRLVPADPLVRPEPLDVRRWSGPADRADRAALAGLAGPLLDVGSGPGRMIRAAAHLDASGVEADPTAVRRSRARGLAVIAGSVFDPLPREGRWGSALLLDGNVGIGGDVAALLARCGELLRRGGLLVVETDADPRRDDTDECRVRSSDGSESAAFPWARVGLIAVLRAAHDFALERVWELDGRWFVRLRAL